ncbi:hypothetical protein G6F56_000971 [Rhizopus delemar]|nr:hypothetical protein G6F56_000971 [Rhizopus delemar]
MSSDSPRTFNANASNKKFTQSMNTNNGRNSHTRQRLLSTKISAPLPINLPSLKSESGTDGPAAHNWGPSTATNPEITHVQPIELPVSRAWAVPSSSPSPPRLEVSGTSKVISNKEKPDQEETKEMVEHSKVSWDEMLNDDADEFSVDVIEFEDGSKFPLNECGPSDRFTEDYDRSYPLKLKPTPPEVPSSCQSIHGQQTENAQKNAWFQDSNSSRRRSINERKTFSVLQKGEQISAAAERAQKRREEQEAEFEAARERARQKANAMKAEEEEKIKNRPKTTLEDDEEAWVKCVEEIKTTKKLVTSNAFGVSAWANYAENLQNNTANETPNPVIASRPVERKPLVLTPKKHVDPPPPSTPRKKESKAKAKSAAGPVSAWNNFVSEELNKSTSQESMSESEHSKEPLQVSPIKDTKPYEESWPYQTRTVRGKRATSSSHHKSKEETPILTKKTPALVEQKKRNEKESMLKPGQQITIMTKKKLEENKSDEDNQSNQSQQEEVLWWDENNEKNYPLERTDQKYPSWSFGKSHALPSSESLTNEHSQFLGRGKGRLIEQKNGQGRVAPVISILQHERTQNNTPLMASEMFEDPIETNYKDKIQDMFKTCQSPIFPQSIQKTIGNKPENLSFMLENKIANKKTNKTKQHIPVMIYKFPLSKKSENTGVYLLPTSMPTQLDVRSLPSSFPLPLRMLP